jgi:hypothetical protein
MLAVSDMSRSNDGLEGRPERVIIVDADDPMKEIHGRFVWQEEHDRVVDDVRREAYTQGYSAGHRDGVAEARVPVRVEFRRGRGLASRLVLALVVLAALCLLLSLPIFLKG